MLTRLLHLRVEHLDLGAKHEQFLCLRLECRQLLLRSHDIGAKALHLLLRHQQGLLPCRRSEHEALQPRHKCQLDHLVIPRYQYITFLLQPPP
jgi:hypothetical protein